MIGKIFSHKKVGMIPTFFVAKYFTLKSKQIKACMLNRVVYSEFVMNLPTISLNGNSPLKSIEASN